MEEAAKKIYVVYRSPSQYFSFLVAAFSDSKKAKRIVKAANQNRPSRDHLKIEPIELDKYMEAEPIAYFTCKVREDGRVYDILPHACAPWEEFQEKAIRYDYEPDITEVTALNLERALELAKEAFERPPTEGVYFYDY